MWPFMKRGLFLAGKVFLAGAAAVGGGVLAKQAVNETQDLSNQVGQRITKWRLDNAKSTIQHLPQAGATTSN